MEDPIEAIVAAGLRGAGIPFERGDDVSFRPPLDFYLPGFDLYVEVKQFHSERIARQMSLAPNVIAIQGRAAAQAFVSMIACAGRQRETGPVLPGDVPSALSGLSVREDPVSQGDGCRSVVAGDDRAVRENAGDDAAASGGPGVVVR